MMKKSISIATYWLLQSFIFLRFTYANPYLYWMENPISYVAIFWVCFTFIYLIPISDMLFYLISLLGITFISILFVITFFAYLLSIKTTDTHIVLLVVFFISVSNIVILCKNMVDRHRENTNGITEK